MAPRGMGTMVAMMFAGRLASRSDPRLLMLSGIAMLAYSLWDMSAWTPDIDVWSITVNTVIQGAGLGFVFIPLQVVAFSTLQAKYRTEGTALFSLVRNVGMAIGVSITSFMLAHNAQVMHAALAEHVTPFNHMLQTGGAYLFWNLANPRGLMALNGEVTRQAFIVAYANDFLLMFLITLPTAFLLFLLRRSRQRNDAGLAIE